MKYVAVFRNLNLGRPRCPTRVQLEQAFLASGAATAASFLSNGTLVFSLPAGGRARKVLAAARAALARDCGLVEPAHLRRLSDLSSLVALDPFAAIERAAVYEYTVSFLAPEVTLDFDLPLRSKRGDVQVLRVVGADVLSLSYKPGASPGSPNALLERLLQSPVTTRSWNTIVRLVDKHG